MRLCAFLLLLLYGCSKPMVRCDAHLKPINLTAATGAAAAAGNAATAVSDGTGTAGGTPPARRVP